MPFEKPGLLKYPTETGFICGGCMHYNLREIIDWDLRRKELKEICDTYRNKWNYDCLIPVSGGKDSHWLVKTMVEDWDMTPLLVTVNDNFAHTATGNMNLKNLINHYELNHFSYTMSDGLFKTATKWAFEQKGQPLALTEYAIYLIPYYLAKQFNIPLVIFGEDSAWEYGTSTFETPFANNKIWFDARCLENEVDWWKEGDVDPQEIYKIYVDVDKSPLVLFMSYFYPWSSVDHLDVAKKRGFKTLSDTMEWARQGVIEDFEQIDSYGYLTHLWLRYPRHGYQRTTDIVSRRIREGKMTKEEGLELIKAHDCCLDNRALQNFCEVLGYTEDDFYRIVRKAKWNKYWIDL
jgi:N-acetyl sugar amidotransferase